MLCELLFGLWSDFQWDNCSETHLININACRFMRSFSKTSFMQNKKRLPFHADWEEVSCGRPVPRTQDQWGRWSWLCSRLPDLYSVQTAQCTTHCSPVVSDKYHHSVVSVLLLCCRCQLNKMTPKLNQTCLVNVRERVSYLCLVKFTDGWTWMSWLHKINLLSIYKHIWCWSH